MEIDETRLKEGLAGARGVQVGSHGMRDAITRIIDSVPPTIGVSGSGLMVIDGDLQLAAIAWSDRAGRALETLQEEIGRGPCVDTLINDRIVAIDDFTTDERWPDLATSVVPLGVHAVLGVPVHVDGECVGALNVYCDEPVCWSDESVEAVCAFAEVLQQLLGVAVLADRSEGLVSQLQQALESRVVIERAVGVVMGRRGVDAVEGFNLLRAKARSERRRVFDVATDLLAGHTGID